MSRFLLPRLTSLAPYEPGEQPLDRRYVKLNTNENPFPPSPKVLEALCPEAILRLNRYPDPAKRALRAALARAYGVEPENVFVGNGSDEVLGFAFMAYADEGRGVTYPAVSYGFYKVYAQLFRARANAVPLNADLTIPVGRFLRQGQMVALANPNAPTGLALPLDALEAIIRENADSVVLIDEAYIDFGGESCLPLLRRYDNLLIVRTFSKSRSLAGGRLGFALASRGIIEDLTRVCNSFHPYSVNALTLAAGVAAVEDEAYLRSCVEAVCAQREQSKRELRALGFAVTDSATNFLFAAPPRMSGEAYYRALKERGVLVRHFRSDELSAYVRITVGAPEEMRRLLQETRAILGQPQEELQTKEASS